MLSKIRVLLVDDHAMVRQGLKSFLELTDEVEVVGEADNGMQALAQFEALQPDVTLMDLVMPELDGIEATKHIRAKNTHAKILILTSFIEDEKVFPALEAGAQGYLLKDTSPDDLIQAIQSIHQGESPLHPKVTKKLMSQLQKKPQAEEKQVSPDAAISSLTQREQEVLECLGRGYSNKDIASALYISLKTVKTHVSNVLAKLDVADRTQAAIYAIKHGLVPLDEP